MTGNASRSFWDVVLLNANGLELQRDVTVFLITSAFVYVAAFPVAQHPPTGFVPAPTQPATYGGKKTVENPSTQLVQLRCQTALMNSTETFAQTVAGAAPYGMFPNQPQLYAATQGPPPPYDQTLTHSMVNITTPSFTFQTAKFHCNDVYVRLNRFSSSTTSD